jgi:hypothetical protein
MMSTNTQVALIEIFRCSTVLDFMSNFDAVCTVADGRVTSGVAAGIPSVVGQVSKIQAQQALSESVGHQHVSCRLVVLYAAGSCICY